LCGAMQVLRGGLIVAALRGEACQRRAMQVLGVSLHLAAIVGESGSDHKKRGENIAMCFIFLSLKRRPCREQK
jgi:hypothetical protein